MCIGIFQNVAGLETLRNSLLTGVVDLQSTGLNAAKNGLLMKFLKGVSKSSENFQEELCNRVSF